jgi:hypothetical protein
VEDYVRPGLGAAIATSTLGIATVVITSDLRSRGAPTLLLLAIAGSMAGLLVLGFVLSAATGSTLGFLSAPRMVRVVLRAPLRVMVVIAIGSGPIAAVGGASASLWATTHARMLLTVVVDAAIAAPLVALASYLAIVTASAMGLLAYADPETLAA